MSENSQEPVHTFTVGFKEETYDERKAAEITAKRAGAVHTSMCVPHHQVLADLPKALEAMDQPTIDGINTWYVARATKQAGITVALSGLGGDELFAGYAIFRELPRIMAAGDLFGRFPNTLRRRFGRALTALAPPSDRWRKAGAFLSKDTYNEHPYFGYRVLFSPGEQAGFMRSVDDRFPDTRDLWQQKMQQDAAQASKYDRIGSISYMELRNYMLNTLLRDADCMSMAHSLEVRVPLIDHCLVETVLALPCRFKRDHATSKPLLLGAVRDLLDDKIMQTPKRTFTFPWDSWLRGPLKSTLQEALVTNPGALDAFMSRKALSQVWERFLGGQTNWARPWALYVLSRWLESNLA
jgi:asparagine synthase (glutamine-hydrolysing)